MGNVTFGVPEDLALDLAKAINAHIFIETGTYKGGTSLWASKHFKSVYTIEFDKNRYEKTFAQISHMANTDNIVMLHGNSKEKLKDALDLVNEPVIFWLDAHGLYAGNMTLEDEIPLMQELQIILDWQEKTNKECCILIDDARLFLAPPPIDKGYHPEYWPTIDDIADFMVFYEMSVAKDVIVLHKNNVRGIVLDWMKK